MKPANRIALVTGAARRMGREIALGLARAGWDVGRRAQAFEADLADETATLALLDRVEQLLGPVGCLVNNASRFEFDTPADFGSASLAAHVGPNLAAPLLLTRRLHELRLAARAHHDVAWPVGAWLVFGSESRGLDPELRERFAADHRIRLPMRPGQRSLNLSNAVAVTVFEAWRQHGFAGSA